MFRFISNDCIALRWILSFLGREGGKGLGVWCLGVLVAWNRGIYTYLHKGYLFCSNS